MTLRNEKGEVLMLAVMGMMMAGGMLLWMFSGHSPMSAMHGGKHPASEVRSGDHNGGAQDASEGHQGDDEDNVLDRKRLRGSSRGEGNPQRESLSIS